MARKILTNIAKTVKHSKDELSVETRFLHDLQTSIELDAEKEFRKPSQYYKPSSMNCIRNMYYQRIGEDFEMGVADYCGVGITNSGSDIHVRIQAAIEGMHANKFKCKYLDVEEYVKKKKLKDLTVVSKSGMETKLRHEKLGLSFMTDGIIKYDGKHYILEVKTEISSKFWRREGVDKYHYNQATAYAIAFNLDKVIFLYISRDTLEMKAYMLTVTDAMKEDLIGKIEVCDEYVKRLHVPPKPKDIDKRTCNYCNYVRSCRKDR